MIHLNRRVHIFLSFTNIGCGLVMVSKHHAKSNPLGCHVAQSLGCLESWSHHFGLMFLLIHILGGSRCWFKISCHLCVRAALNSGLPAVAWPKPNCWRNLESESAYKSLSFSSSPSLFLHSPALCFK